MHRRSRGYRRRRQRADVTFQINLGVVFIAALLLVPATLAGTYFQVHPFSTIMKATLPEASGEAMPASPPPGTGRRPLADPAAEYRLQPPAMIRFLVDAGITAEPQWTIKEIAGKIGWARADVNGVSQKGHGTLSSE